MGGCVKARSTENLHDFANNEFTKAFEIISNIDEASRILKESGLLNDFLTGYNHETNINSMSLETLSKIAELAPSSEKLKREIIDERIEHYRNHGYVDEDSSKTFNKMKELIDLAFNIEELFSHTLSEYWANITRRYDDFENGQDDFAFLVGPPEEDDKPYIRTSLITENQIAIQASKLGIVYEVEKGGVLAMSDKKINLAKTKNDTILSLFKFDGENYVSSSIGDSKLMLPNELIQKNINKCLRVNSEYLVYDEVNIFNNVILDKSKSKAKGIVIISSLYDFPFEEFVKAKRLQEDLDLDIKFVSLSTYRSNFSKKTNFAINIKSKTSYEKDNFKRQIDKFRDSDELFGEEPEKLLNLIDEFEELIYDEELCITDKIVKYEDDKELLKNDAKTIVGSIIDMLVDVIPEELSKNETTNALYEATYKIMESHSSEINVKDVLDNKRKSLNKKLEIISNQKEV